MPFSSNWPFCLDDPLPKLVRWLLLARATTSETDLATAVNGMALGGTAVLTGEMGMETAVLMRETAVKKEIVHMKAA